MRTGDPAATSRADPARLSATEPGHPFEAQRKQLKLGEPPAARVVVMFLALHFVATGERLQIPRQRCRDVTEARKRAIVGPLSDFGFDIAHVSDDRTSPGVSIAEVVVPVRRG